MKTGKRPCGCHIEHIGHMPERIAFCAMHEAASDTLEALKGLVTDSTGDERAAQWEAAKSAITKAGG